MEAITWIKNQIVDSPESDYDMRNTQANESSNSAMSSSGKWFWTIITVIDLIILLDLLLNNGTILIDLLFLSTGGYGG